MSTVTLEEAKTKLGELVERLPREGEIVITDGTKPVARLSRITSGSHSFMDFKPHSLGNMLRPYPHPDDDILGEMLDNKCAPNKE